MKLKITEPGFQKLNGPVAEVMFEDGVSVTDVSPDQALRISAAMRCETLEGVNPSASAELLRSHEARAEVVPESKRMDSVGAVVEVAKPTPEPAPQGLGEYSREGLEALADKGGIKAIRKVAEHFGVKGTSIRELIDETLEAQAVKKATAAKG